MEDKYKCDKCNYSCKFKSTWEKHINTELHKTGVRKKRSDCQEPYKCNECNYETKNSVTYKKHMLNEHADKETREKQFKFYCKYCDIGTFSTDTMEQHNQTKKHKKSMTRNKKIEKENI